jgi:hypothetical protein
VSLDPALQRKVTSEVLECEGARNPEGRRVRVHQSHPSVVDRCQRIFYFGGKSLWRKVELSGARTPKGRSVRVHQNHPLERDTWQKICHFREKSLQEKKECVEQELPKAREPEFI